MLDMKWIAPRVFTQFVLCGLLAIGAARIAAADSDEVTFPVPFKSVDLPSGHFFTGGAHGAGAENGDRHARDWKARRQNENGKWVSGYEEIADNPHCADDETGCDVFGRSIIYRVPLYAPVDGEVLSCWRRYPNNPANRTSIPKRCCKEQITDEGKCVIGSCGSPECAEAFAPAEPVCQVRKSGNFIAILTKDDELVAFSHLAPGTIPKRLCPFRRKFMDNVLDKWCGGGDCSHLPEEAVIPEGERPLVRRGDFVGRVGITGGATIPHVHIHWDEVTINDAGIVLTQGGHEPYLIDNAWMRPSAAPEWQKLEGWELKKTDENPQPLILASPFRRTDKKTADPIADVSLAGSVTSAIGATGKLEVTAWEVAADGSIQQQQSAQGVAVDLVASTLVGSDRDVVTASRNAGGDLRVDSWTVSNGGNVTHQDQEVAGPVGDVAITQAPTGLGAVVAVEAGNGNLKLISYQTDAGGNLERKGSVEGGAVRAVSVARIRKGRRAGEDPSTVFEGVATAVKTEGGKLRVRTWAWDPSTETLSLAQSVTGEEILGQVAIAAVPTADDRQVLVTAARTEDGMLLQSWSVNSAGELEKRWSQREGDARHITINAVSDARFVTSFEDGQGNLRVEGWSLGPKGKISRVGEVDAGAVSRVSSSLLRRDGGGTRLILTAMRDGQDRLRMIVYDTNL